MQRQYSGTAGRIENCQIGVFPALVGSRGRCPIDRELYLPRDWCDDRQRRAEAHVPQEVEFATKPQLAMAMLRRAFDAGLRPAWVLGDEVYGEWRMRRLLEERGVPYVLAVGRDQRLWRGFRQVRVDAIADGAPDVAWHRLSCGTGTKGERVYGWAAARHGLETDTGLHRWLLVRRQVHEPRERAYYLCAAPPDAGAAGLAAAAGRRWAIESCFEASGGLALRGQAGDGARRVRGARLGGLAPPRDALDARAGVPRRRSRRSRGPAGAEKGARRGAVGDLVDLVPLTEPEVRRLLVRVAWPKLAAVERTLAWSAWRRHHQAVARRCHHRARSP